MMDDEEYIDILHPDGSPTGESCLKSEIHEEGYYHNTAHVWLYNANADILLAQRSASKTIYPMLWDVSVAGHVDTGEAIEQAAIREIKEEIGIDIPQIKFVTISEFLELLKKSKTNSHFIASNAAYYRDVIHAIQTRLT